MPGARALQWSAPKGRPLPHGGLFPRRRGAASGQGRGPVKAFRGQRMPPSVKGVFCAWALGRTAGNGFSTKKAILRLRRPFAATDGLQNRHFKQASDGRHGKARSFFVCGDAAAAPEDGASDHGLALFVFRGAFCIQRNIPSAPRRNDKVYRSGDKPENAGGFFAERFFGMALRGLRFHGLRCFLFLRGPR